MKKNLILKGLIAIVLSFSIFTLGGAAGFAETTKAQSVAEIKIARNTDASDDKGTNESTAGGTGNVSASGKSSNGSSGKYPQTNEIQAGILSFVGVSLATLAILLLKKKGAEEK